MSINSAALASQLRRDGRLGDTVLAHISPQEAAMLLRAGGAGTANPKDKLPEFWNPGGNSDQAEGMAVTMDSNTRDPGIGGFSSGTTPSSSNNPLSGNSASNYGYGAGNYSTPGSGSNYGYGAGNYSAPSPQLSQSSPYGSVEGMEETAGSVDPTMMQRAPMQMWNAAPPTTSYAPTARERDMMIRTVAAEDQSNPTTMAGVASVINNRFQDAATGTGMFGLYGKTLGDQISAKDQFSGYGDKNYNGISANSPEYNQIGNVVDGVLAGTTPDPTYGATSYHANYVSPSWARGQPYQAIGRQNYLGGVPSSAGLAGTHVADDSFSSAVADALGVSANSTNSAYSSQYGAGNYPSQSADNTLQWSASPAQSAQYADASQYGAGNYSTPSHLPSRSTLAPGGYWSQDSRGNPVAVQANGNAVGYDGSPPASWGSAQAQQQGLPSDALSYADPASGQSLPAAAGSPFGTLDSGQPWASAPASPYGSLDSAQPWASAPRAAAAQTTGFADPNTTGDYPSLPDSLFQSRSLAANSAPTPDASSEAWSVTSPQDLASAGSTMGTPAGAAGNWNPLDPSGFATTLAAAANPSKAIAANSGNPLSSPVDRSQLAEGLAVEGNTAPGGQGPLAEGLATQANTSPTLADTTPARLARQMARGGRGPLAEGLAVQRRTSPAQSGRQLANILRGNTQ